MEDFSIKDPGAALKLASPIKGLSNRMKNYRGKLTGMKRINLVETRKIEEKKLQEFISKEGGYPEGFCCSWAFADIQRDLVHLRLGGDYPWIKEKGAILASCTDGARPVIFKLERVE